MLRCLELASRGLGQTKTNPLVGCVIVYNNKVIGEGFHEYFGGPHAEVNAINSVSNQNLLAESTLYVNLEPCSHFGKTPPCAMLIKQKSIPRVVVAMNDPNPVVSGRGIKMLKESGITVNTGILEKEARFLNRRFVTNQEKKRPYVILKWAQSSDGFIDILRKPGDPIQPNWITNKTARILVHKWRSEESAILAGVNTILTDNPALNLRDWPGENPTRVVVDRKLRIPRSAKLLDDKSKTLIFTSKEPPKATKNTRYLKIDENYNPKALLSRLLEEGISSVIIEGGALTLDLFINNNLWDEARIFTGKQRFGEGVPAPELKSGKIHQYYFRNSHLMIQFNQNT